MAQSKKKVLTPKKENLSAKIYESINDFVKEHDENPVAKGDKFCEWVLNNIFDLREDEIIEAAEIGGQFDNGIDSLFQTEAGLFILQCKFGSSHSLEGMLKFREDCERLLFEVPIANRQIVLEKCKDIRQQFENGESIFCYYITNEEFTKLETTRVSGLSKIYPNVDINFLDIEAITETIAEKSGSLPKGIRDKKIKLYIEKGFESDNTSNG